MFAVLLSMTLGQAPTPTPLETIVFKLRNQAAADVAAAIKKPESGNQYYVTPEPISNSLFISAAAADVVRIVEQINKLDIPTPQYIIDIRVCVGDPLGSRAAGTLKVISEPRVVATEGKPAFIRAGGQTVVEPDGELVSIGVEMKVTVLSMKDVTARVRIEGANTTLEGPEKDRSLKTVRSITTREVKAGEMTRVRIGQKADETWAEVTVRPVEAMTPPPPRPQPAK